MSIYGMIYEELQAKIKHLTKDYKQYEGAFDILDRELIADIILDGDTFWFEWYNLPSGELKDKDILTLKRYLMSKGYNYLYG